MGMHCPCHLQRVLAGGRIKHALYFEKAFDGEKGLGYPAERRESQNANAIILSNMKEAVSKPLMDALQAIDPELLKQALGGEKFQKCFFNNSKDKELVNYVKNLLDR